jgi:hypothetical protein
MRTIPTQKLPRRLAASLVLSTGAALLAPAAAPASAAVAAAPCLGVTGVPPTGPVMNGVTVQTACSAWATAGSTIDHWDGANWTGQEVPDPAGGSSTLLIAVTATSTANAWAGGRYISSTASNIQPLIDHWNGTAWAASSSPALPGGEGGAVLDLSTSSATDAWGVGLLLQATNQRGILTEHWDGKAWTQVPAPVPAGDVPGAEATGVADISPTNAWMVGNPAGITASGPAWIQHWDGKAWTVAPVAGMPAGSQLSAVRALSATNVWAVGTTANSPLILHYDGTSWTVQSGIPSPGTSSELQSVAVTSTGAMAVGQFTDTSGTHPLMLLWNGTTWAQLPAPSPGDSAELSGVGGTSNNYWAVGSYPTSTGSGPLALHCC